MTTAKLTSKTGLTGATMWFCIGTLTTLVVLWALGWSLRPLYAAGVVVGTVAGLVAISRKAGGH